MTTRRRFLQIVPAAAGAALLTTQTVMAQANMVGERDQQAVALGYVADAARVDRAKYKQYASGQTCANCQHYQGKRTDPAGGCPLFGTKQVAGKGWCSAWAKRA